MGTFNIADSITQFLAESKQSAATLNAIGEQEIAAAKEAGNRVITAADTGLKLKALELDKEEATQRRNVDIVKSMGADASDPSARLSMLISGMTKSIDSAESAKAAIDAKQAIKFTENPLDYISAMFSVQGDVDNMAAAQDETVRYARNIQNMDVVKQHASNLQQGLDSVQSNEERGLKLAEVSLGYLELADKAAAAIGLSKRNAILDKKVVTREDLDMKLRLVTYQEQQADRKQQREFQNRQEARLAQKDLTEAADLKYETDVFRLAAVVTNTNLIDPKALRMDPEAYKLRARIGIAAFSDGQLGGSIGEAATILSTAGAVPNNASSKFLAELKSKVIRENPDLKEKDLSAGIDRLLVPTKNKGGEFEGTIINRLIANMEQPTDGVTSNPYKIPRMSSIVSSNHYVANEVFDKEVLEVLAKAGVDDSSMDTIQGAVLSAADRGVSAKELAKGFSQFVKSGMVLNSEINNYKLYNLPGYIGGKYMVNGTDFANPMVLESDIARVNIAKKLASDRKAAFARYNKQQADSIARYNNLLIQHSPNN